MTFLTLNYSQIDQFSDFKINADIVSAEKKLQFEINNGLISL